jgi:hypothetical protein
MLYLNAVSVTPDQVWAFRRVLPIVTPTLLVAAALGLAMLARRGTVRRWSAAALVTLSAAATLLPWGQIFFVPEGGAQRSEISAICDQVHSTDATLIAAMGTGLPPNYALTLRTICQVQTVTLNGDADLAGVAAANSGPVAVVTYDPALVDWVVEPQAPTVTTAVRLWDRHLLETPRTTSLTVRSAWVGELESTGKVSPLDGHDQEIEP